MAWVNQKVSVDPNLNLNDPTTKEQVQQIKDQLALMAYHGLSNPNAMVNGPSLNDITDGELMNRLQDVNIAVMARIRAWKSASGWDDYVQSEWDDFYKSLPECVEQFLRGNEYAHLGSGHYSRFPRDRSRPQPHGVRGSRSLWRHSIRGLDGRKSHRYGAWRSGTRWREYCSRLFRRINGPPGGAALKIAKTLSMIIAAAALQAACASAQPSRQGFTYVYGNLSIETGLGIERFGAASYSSSNCSTSTTHCIRGEVFTLSTPVECTAFSKGEFGEGSATTIVLRREVGPLASEKLRPGYYASPVWLLGSSQRPHVVFVYAAEGVLGLYRDPTTDVVNVARGEGLAGLRRLGGNEDAAHLPLITSVPWGGCRGRIEEAAAKYEGPPSPQGHVGSR